VETAATVVAAVLAGSEGSAATVAAAVMGVETEARFRWDSFQKTRWM
jgi:hypothetical protein